MNNTKHERWNSVWQCTNTPVTKIAAVYKSLLENYEPPIAEEDKNFIRSEIPRILNINDPLIESDISFKKLGLSLEYIKKNTGSNCPPLPNDSSKKLASLRLDDYAFPDRTKQSGFFIREKTFFQHSVMLKKQISCICPVCGKILCSDTSFYFNHDAVAFYRFECEHVFYMLVGNEINIRAGLYFPSENAAVMLDCMEWGINRKLDKLIPMFKLFCITKAKKVLTYLINPEKRRLAAVVSSHNNLGHYIYNELTALHLYHENGLLSNADLILDGPHRHIDFSRIFPDADKFKIFKINHNFPFIDFILENNLFVFKFTDCFIKADLSDRIYNACRETASENTIKTSKMARAHFPLIWINLRKHNREWLEQEEGLPEIINALQQEYPGLGVILCGWPACDEPYEKMTSIIKEEHKLAARITSRIKDGIPVFNVVGASIADIAVYAKASDYFIGNNGSDSIVFMRWLDCKPGMFYGNKRYSKPDERLFSFCERYNPLPLQIPPKYVTDEGTPDAPSNNWHCDWKNIYNEISKHLKELAGKGLLSARTT